MDRSDLLNLLNSGLPAPEHIPDEFRNDREVVPLFIQRNWRYFRQASDQLQVDFNFLEQCIQKDCRVIRYVPETIQIDYRLYSIALKKLKPEHRIRFINTFINPTPSDRKFWSELFRIGWNHTDFYNLINDKAPHLLNDRKFCMTVIRWNLGILNHFPTLLQDREVMHIMLDRAIGCSELKPFLTADFMLFGVNYPEFVMKILQNNGDLLAVLPGSYRNNPEYVRAAITSRSTALQYASEDLLQDKGFVLEMVGIDDSRGENYIPEAYSDDREVVLRAIEVCGTALKYASERLKDDEHLVEIAINQKARAFCYASERLRDDDRIVNIAVDISGRVYRYASDRLRNDRQLALRAIRQMDGDGYWSGGVEWQALPETLRHDREVLLAEAYSKYFVLMPEDLAFIPPQFMADREVLYCLHSNWSIDTNCLPEAFQNDPIFSRDVDEFTEEATDYLDVREGNYQNCEGDDWWNAD